MGILENIDSAAYDLERGRLGELTPVARNFTIVRDMPLENCVSTYRVFSYNTLVGYVSKCFDNELLILIKPSAFRHSTTTTTSKHVRRFLSALLGRVDWDALYKECDKETISGNGARFINVREVA